MVLNYRGHHLSLQVAHHLLFKSRNGKTPKSEKRYYPQKVQTQFFENIQTHQGHYSTGQLRISIKELLSSVPLKYQVRSLGKWGLFSTAKSRSQRTEIESRRKDSLPVYPWSQEVCLEVQNENQDWRREQRIWFLAYWSLWWAKINSKAWYRIQIHQLEHPKFIDPFRLKIPGRKLQKVQLN